MKQQQIARRATRATTASVDLRTPSGRTLPYSGAAIQTPDTAAELTLIRQHHAGLRTSNDHSRRRWRRT